MGNELAKALKRKVDNQFRVTGEDYTPSIMERPDGSVILIEPSENSLTYVAGKNVNIGTSGSNKVINAVMNVLAGANIEVSAPDENGAVTVTGSIKGKSIDITDFAGKNGYALTYNETIDKFELAQMTSGGGASTAAGVSIEDSANNFTASNVEDALSELFTSVSSGKVLIAGAITDKGIVTSASDEFSTMATNISNIPQEGGSPVDPSVRFKSSIKPIYTASANSVSILIPSSVEPGDLLVACLFARSVVTAPPGWNLIKKQSVFTANTQWCEVYYKIAAESDSGSTISFLQETAGRMAVGVVVAACPPNGIIIEDVNGATSSTIAGLTTSLTSLGKGRLCVAIFSTFYGVATGKYELYHEPGKWAILNDPYIEANRLSIGVKHLKTESVTLSNIYCNAQVSDSAAIGVVFAPA